MMEKGSEESQDTDFLRVRDPVRDFIRNYLPALQSGCAAGWTDRGEGKRR